MQKLIDFIHAIFQNFDLDSKEESSDKDEETQEGKPDSAWSRHILHPRSLILLLHLYWWVPQIMAVLPPSWAATLPHTTQSACLFMK